MFILVSWVLCNSLISCHERLCYHILWEGMFDWTRTHSGICKMSAGWVSSALPGVIICFWSCCFHDCSGKKWWLRSFLYVRLFSFIKYFVFLYFITSIMSYQHTLYWRQVSRHSNCVDNFLTCKEMLENEFLSIIRGLSQLLIVSEILFIKSCMSRNSQAYQMNGMSCDKDLQRWTLINDTVLFWLR